MNDLVNLILQWIHLHPHSAGFITFLISAGESVAIIGTIVPGSVMMTAIGTLAGSGIMPIWSTILWAILGAVVGDGISYWMGYRFKHYIHQMWPFKNNPILLSTGESFVHRHGGISVFIGRFVGPVRALVPLIAGMLRLDPKRFYIANITSAIFWAPAYIFPGILLGIAAVKISPNLLVHGILLLLVLVCVICVACWLLKYSCVWLLKKIETTLNQIWHHLEVKRFCRLCTLLLKHHDPRYQYGQLILAFYTGISIFLFLLLFFYIHMHGSAGIEINQSIYHLFRGLHFDTHDNIAYFITFLGEKRVILPTVFILFCWLLLSHHKRSAWHLLVLTGLVVVTVFSVKLFSYSPRPEGIMSHPINYSFPSGHSALSLAIYGFITSLLSYSLKKRYRKYLYAVSALLIFSIGLSRLYLGIHWLTDIIGGWLLAICTMMLIRLSYNRQMPKKINIIPLLSIFLISIFVTTSLYTHQHLVTSRKNNTRIWPTHELSASEWKKSQGALLPLFRNNRLGDPDQPLTIQWLDSQTHIESYLLKNGWKTAPKRDWVGVLHRVTNINSAQYMPLLPLLFDDKEPTLVLVKRIPQHRNALMFRLWDSGYRTKDNDIFWVATLDFSQPRSRWFFRKRYLPSFSKVEWLAPQPQECHIRTVRFPSASLNKKELKMLTTGMTLLMITPSGE